MYKNILYNLYNKALNGRNGIDDLVKFQFIILIVLTILDIFLDSYIVGLLQLITMITIGYRFMSKNLYKRVKENQIYNNIRYGIISPFKNIIRRIKDRKHLYKKCSCGTTIKTPLPKKRGIKHTTCPNCGKRNRIIALRKKK
ncbi:MAG: hypothetical protein IJA30_02690 [Bacilli bacterium]|nr:hypothetical protein [Bacilli bacterium]